VQRAVAAGLCEPRLLRDRDHAAQVLNLVDGITEGLVRIDSKQDRKSGGFAALQKALGYCWSVAIVGNPDVGKPLFERWVASDDAAVRWIVRENLKKNRLMKVDANWVERQKPNA
jgi:hypothetical protein